MRRRQRRIDRSKSPPRKLDLATRLSRRVESLRRYHATGEINFHNDDKDGTIKALVAKYKDGRQDMLDGVTVEFGDLSSPDWWWFNVRPSNTEPLLRLNLEARNAATRDARRAELVAMLGTPDELDTRDSILFLEDTGTRPYALDRLLQQLRLAGKFDGVRGIVFGEMTDCVQHAEQGYTIQEALAECTADLGIPVLFGLHSGHSPRGNLTLPLGVAASLDADRGELRIEESAIREEQNG